MLKPINFWFDDFYRNAGEMLTTETIYVGIASDDSMATSRFRYE